METRKGTGLGLSATLGRRERAKAEKRAHILAAARALFEERWGKWVPHRYRDSRPPASLPGAR